MFFLCHVLLLAALVHAASWFSRQPEYARWSDADLRAWLAHHSIAVPASFDKPLLCDLVDANWKTTADAARQWSSGQYSSAQRAFQHIRDDALDTWDESRLRAFLLEQGVVAPPGPREQLVLLAKHRYRAYTDAAALYSSLASASASSAYAGATDAAHAASQCISSVAAQATHEVARAFDASKDFVYSTWDDSHLRAWLEEHGIAEAKSATTRDELASLANDYYRKPGSAVWESWSDSYIREWLVAHNLLRPSDTPSRSGLLGEMKKYYYNYADSVWNTWSDSQLKSWLVDRGFLKGDAERKRDELVEMLEEYYLSASDTVWGAWTDSDIHEWLLERGYLENRHDVKSRKDLVALMNSKCSDASTKAASYLVWPDARLRAYLRERGVSEGVLPTNRPGLLQETRIRWVQTSNWAESIYARLKDIVNSSVEAAEEKVARVLEVLSGHSRDAEHYASDKIGEAGECADTKKTRAWSWGSHKVDQAEDVRQRGDEL